MSSSITDMCKYYVSESPFYCKGSHTIDVLKQCVEPACFYCNVHESDGTVMTLKEIDQMAKDGSFKGITYVGTNADVSFAPFLSGELFRVLLENDVLTTTITKGPLSEYIFNLFQQHPNYIIPQVSIPCLDDEYIHKTEGHHRPSAEMRLHTIQKLKDHGMNRIIVNIMPLFPGVNDSEDDLKRIVEESVKRGATHFRASYGILFSGNENASRFLENDAEMSQAYSLMTDSIQALRYNGVTVPFSVAEQMYELVQHICQDLGVVFAACNVALDNRLQVEKHAISCCKTLSSFIDLN